MEGVQQQEEKQEYQEQKQEEAQNTDNSKCKKYRILTYEQKRRIVEKLKQDDSPANYFTLSEEYKTSIKNMKRWVDFGVQRKPGCGRKKLNVDAEQKLKVWILEESISQGKRAIKLFDHPNFRASKAWQDEFIKQFDIKFIVYEALATKNFLTNSQYQKLQQMKSIKQQKEEQQQSDQQQGGRNASIPEKDENLQNEINQENYFEDSQEFNFYGDLLFNQKYSNQYSGKEEQEEESEEQDQMTADYTNDQQENEIGENDESVVYAQRDLIKVEKQKKGEYSFSQEIDIKFEKEQSEPRNEQEQIESVLRTEQIESVFQKEQIESVFQKEQIKHPFDKEQIEPLYENNVSQENNVNHDNNVKQEQEQQIIKIELKENKKKRKTKRQTQRKIKQKEEPQEQQPQILDILFNIENPYTEQEEEQQQAEDQSCLNLYVDGVDIRNDSWFNNSEYQCFESQ